MEAKKGMVFNIQHCSIHDGPGIRTTVFLKGCPLRCLWCANPESQNIDVEETIENGKTIIYGEEKTVEEVMQEVLEDKVFYGGEGGMTLSGGEILMQPEFALALLQAAKEAGISTAVETSGYGSEEALQSMIPYIDHFLYDIKAVDREQHRKCTGVYNDKIIRNLKMIDQTEGNFRIQIRVPLIPDYNDSDEAMRAIGMLVGELKHVESVQLLPYHNLGEGKREALGREAFECKVPEKEYMDNRREVVRSTGVTTLEY